MQKNYFIHLIFLITYRKYPYRIVWPFCRVFPQEWSRNLQGQPWLNIYNLTIHSVPNAHKNVENVSWQMTRKIFCCCCLTSSRDFMLPLPHYHHMLHLFLSMVICFQFMWIFAFVMFRNKTISSRIHTCGSEDSQIMVNLINVKLFAVIYRK